MRAKTVTRIRLEKILPMLPIGHGVLIPEGDVSIANLVAKKYGIKIQTCLWSKNKAKRVIGVTNELKHDPCTYQCCRTTGLYNAHKHHRQITIRYDLG